MESYKDLFVYQESRRMNKGIYELTALFPATERSALADQLRRACISITSNIAEGYGQGSFRNRLRYLYMARGSAYETETQLLVATDLGFIEIEKSRMVVELAIKIEKLLNGLIRSTEERIKAGVGTRIGETAEEYGVSKWEE